MTFINEVELFMKEVRNAKKTWNFLEFLVVLKREYLSEEYCCYGKGEHQYGGSHNSLTSDRMESCLKKYKNTFMLV